MTTGRRTWYVTQRLYLGDHPDRPKTTKVTTADEAVEVISRNGIAVLPEGAWELADEVLWRRGLGVALRKHILHWARTGTILKPIPEGMLDEEAEPEPRLSAVDPAWAHLPEVPDALKVERPEDLLFELSALQVEDDFRYAAVVRIAAGAVSRGMDPNHALRRALDETAAEDEARDAMLARRLAETLKWRPMMPLDELMESLGESPEDGEDDSG
jgi:hypothetical protein